MSPLTRSSLRFGVALLLASAVSAAFAHEGYEHGNSPDPVSAEAPFIQENAAAMETMMAGMDSKPTGDIDRDFVTMMSAHHQGAIDMAVTLLKYGHNEQLKRMAHRRTATGNCRDAPGHRRSPAALRRLTDPDAPGDAALIVHP